MLHTVPVAVQHQEEMPERRYCRGIGNSRSLRRRRTGGGLSGTPGTGINGSAGAPGIIAITYTPSGGATLHTLTTMGVGQ